MPLTVLAACSAGFTEDTADGARYLYASMLPRPNGLSRVRIEVAEGEAAMLVTSRVDAPYRVFTRRVFDPSGNQVLLADDFTNSDFSKTNAVFVDQVSTLNWPISVADGPLVPGIWEVELGVVDENLRFTSQPLLVDVLLKPDADLAVGQLDVAVVYTDGLGARAGVVEAVDAATAHWADLYALSGIDVRFSSFSLNEREILPPAFGADERITALSSDTPPRTVNLVLSDTIQVQDLDILGIAGDIPGPLIPTPRSAVQISLDLAAGPDGSFDELDTRILAETMAHETAHFLGLFHPVERTGWDHWDVLDDTVECGGETTCIRRLGSNLMFPYPVCGLTTCTPQDEITDDQQSVLHRYVGVR